LWPFFSSLLTWVTTDSTNPEKAARARQEITSLLPNLMRGLLNGALLPHQAVVSLDAIGRVLYRRLVSHKLMLQWETARVAGQSATQREQQFLWRLLGGLFFSAGLTFAVRSANPGGFLYAAPYLVSWSFLPLLVKWLHGAYLPPSHALGAEEKVYLRQIARQTWRYFDDFIGPQTNWLAPDNYQERLRVEIAQRTSPTNIGMGLMAFVAAHDFGYISGDDAIGRLLPTFRNLHGLERYNGHFLNWYETQRQEALRPRYVSTVDSGNLLGCFLALIESIEDITRAPVLDQKALQGLADTLELLYLSLQNNPALSNDASLQSDLAELKSLFNNEVEPLKIVERLRQAQAPTSRLARQVSSIAPSGTPATQRQSADLAVATSDPRFTTNASAYWAAQLETQLEAWLHIAQRYLCWHEKLAQAPDLWLWPLGEDAPSLRREILNAAPSLKGLAGGNLPAFSELMARREREGLTEETTKWLREVQEEFERSKWLAGEIMADAVEVINRAGQFTDEMDFGFLYDAERKLFSIGFNVEEMRLDNSYYDLLASECRLASFLAVARDEVPVEHWLNLGRRFGKAPDGSAVLLSWSGTMFEYLMPLIFTPNSPHSLLDWACQSAVHQQIAYGRARGVPWGISEAAFSALDAQKTYQYKAFGAPVLGLKRGLEEELVVAPYATVMALMVEPQEAFNNLQRLEKMGMRGDYGFYESVDFKHVELGDEALAPLDRTLDRTQNRRGVIVRTFMVHHQGMSLLALDNVINANVLQDRFSRQPLVRAALPLLHEKVPVAPTILDESVREAPPKPVGARTGSSHERLNSPDSPAPRVNLLSNGNLSAMTTNAGGSYLRWKQFEITRWRADSTRDQWGSFLYIRDLESNVRWSAAHQPLRRAARHSSVSFRPEKTEYHRRDNDIETRLHVCISPEDDAEIRLLQLNNLSSTARVLEVTSFAEVCLAPHNADRAHPAFSKLFVQTESVLDGAALLAWRRLRSPHDAPIWGGHVLATPLSGEISFESDRLQFLGRNRTSEDPQALNSQLSNTAGAVLDPCFSLRQRIVLAPGQRVQLAFTTFAGPSREAVLQIAEKYRDIQAAERALDLAWTHAQLEMHHLGLDDEALQGFQHLASYMIYPFDALRAPAKRLRDNRRSQSGLWAHGISGDLPILVLNVGDERDLPFVREAMQAHAFWRRRGFACDLVILNEEASGYNQDLNEGLRRAAIAVSPQVPHEQLFDQPGGIFVRAGDQLSPEDLTLLLAVARVVLVAARGALAQQLGTTQALPEAPKNLQKRSIPEQPSAPLPFMHLEYFNSIGGFTPDGKEYAIYLGPGTQTPLPWVNVFASPLFGSVISESGRGFTWYGNSQSNRLTPWNNDPVSEGAGDCIYIRDEETGTYWTPTPSPIRENDAYRARHGQGYTIFEHNSHAIEQELTMFVPLGGAMGEDSPPIRIARLKLKNASSRKRRLRVTHYSDWVLGTTREEMQPNIVTQWDSAEKILLARNYYRPDFSHHVAFASASPMPRSWSSDRTSFLGRNGSPQKPLAMEKQHLDERTGAGFDCGAAIQVLVDLDIDEETEVIFLLGEANDIEAARFLVRRFRDGQEVERALRQTQSWWDDFLGSLQVDVPILGVNFLLNRWLPYQALSCRVWGRSALYQSGGAFGFRDQLQDVMAFMHSRPQIAREQILRAAAHQFEEGDVQHWWHPPSDAGVRTRFADDLLWMPYVTSHYIEATGDASILDESIGFLKGEPLAADEHEVYNRPQISEQNANLFEHCRRAIEKGCTYGPHQLPLIGTGDWNDGLNRVGVDGKGESVWMAWFLCDVLNKFANLCEMRGESQLAEDFRKRASAYAKSTEEQAWDGEWYVRAFFDDGSPMGSKKNLEAQIDSLPQSWAILTGCADKQRANEALQAAYERLVLHDKEMILLFTPAFDKTDQDPGYIKGYLPGVRENGGQYTHAATWLALAFAEQGNGDKAVELLQMLNPIEHAREPEETQNYKVEPYAIVADVYNLPGHIGRGGWTWYTGSASWVYRVWVEGVLGFKLHGDKLEINPAIPKEWPGFSMVYRYRSATYEIRVENPHGIGNGVTRLEVDGAPVETIQLADDGQTHQVVVRLGEVIPSNGEVAKAVTAGITP
ncbi:MAG TPA: glucoamylase family protein, partial [Abditibacteriaceae bacterium]